MVFHNCNTVTMVQSDVIAVLKGCHKQTIHTKEEGVGIGWGKNTRKKGKEQHPTQ